MDGNLESVQIIERKRKEKIDPNDATNSSQP
jgi:hypothetical protein